MKSDFTSILLTSASPKEAFTAINNVRGWWTENIEGSTNKLRDIFTVRFGTTWKTFKIVEVVPGEKVIWLITDCYLPWNGDKTEWTGTKISFEISKKREQTQIRFSHLGLVPELECFKSCSNAWTGYIQNSLQRLINTGKGKPTVKEGS